MMWRTMCCVLAVGLSWNSVGQAQEPAPYGPAISLAMAKKVMAAAEAKANENKWPVAITILDSAGYPVLVQRLDNTQLGSVEVSLQKAKTAVLFRRSTKVFEDLVAQGGAGVRILSLPGALPIEGGLPIIHNGQVIGGIGVSGVKSTEDAEVAAAGLSVLAE